MFFHDTKEEEHYSSLVCLRFQQLVMHLNFKLSKANCPKRAKARQSWF